MNKFSVETDGPDNVYFNAIMAGPQNTNDFNGDEFYDAEFSITRTTPIVPCSSDYYCSIIRFAIPLSQIPILIMPILPGCDTYNPPPATPRNITPFIIAIRYNGVNYTQNLVANDFTGVGGPNLSANIIFTSEDPNHGQIFQTSLIEQKIDVSVMGIHSYRTFINMINTTLALSFANFAAANPAAPQAVAAPFFVYNTVTQLISLIAPISWATTSAQFVTDPLNVARVVMNFELGFYLQGFLSLQTHDDTLPVPVNDRQFIVQNLGNNGYPTNVFPAVPTWLEMTQDYNLIANWNSLRKLIITTNTLPINTEAIPTGDITTGISSSKPIISDFIPQLTVAGDSRSVAYYNPTAQYKLVDMNQNTPLQKVDLKIYWEDIDNNLYPLRIPKYNQASIKLAFFKKSLYKKLWPK